MNVPGCMTFLAGSLQPLMFITSFICGKELIIAHAAWSGDFRGTNKANDLLHVVCWRPVCPFRKKASNKL